MTVDARLLLHRDAMFGGEAFGGLQPFPDGCLADAANVAGSLLTTGNCDRQGEGFIGGWSNNHGC